MSARRVVVVVASLAALQAVLAGIYFVVERTRGAPSVARTTAIAEGRAPDLSLLRADGSHVRLSELHGRHVLVHFWATWCEPCRTELPTLLAMAGDASLRDRLVVLAVSVDEDWPAVRAFFPAAVPPVVVRAEGAGAHASYGGTRLPDTYLVSPDGTLRSRYEGARDWSNAKLRDELSVILQSTTRSN